jgi:DNA repair exonuclease SbcCD ATPase subunit
MIKMKTTISLTIVFIAIASFSLAQTTGSEISEIVPQLKKQASKLEGLSRAQKMNDQKGGDIKWGQEELDKKEKKLKADRADLEVREAPIIKIQNSHNANHPDPNCGSCVDAYNAESDKYDPIVKSLLKEEDGLTKQEQLLETLKQTITEQTVNWFAEKKRINAEMNEAIENYNRLYNRLQTLIKQYEECKTLLARQHPSIEQLKYQCGMIQFDGANKDIADVEIIKPTPFKVTPNQ